MPKKPKTLRRKSTQSVGEPTRRDAMKVLRNGVIGAGIVAGGGFTALGSFRAYAAEHDLSRIGQGDPVIVQVHDPGCSMCTTLQKQTRKALKSFDNCGLTYLVADINTPEGAAFAQRFGVPHVTLVLLDGAGNRRQTLSGIRSADQLRPVFAKHKVA